MEVEDKFDKIMNDLKEIERKLEKKVKKKNYFKNF